MEIDDRIFLSRPKDVAVDDVVLLAEAFSDAAKDADSITLLSAYYGAEYLAEVLGGISKTSRKNCKLTLVFGIETTSQMAFAVEDLRRLRATLKGFKDAKVRIFHRDAPFHTKLFYFKRATRPVWFVGSANASSAIAGARHEMMVRLTGRHDALANYMQAVVDNAVDIEAVSHRVVIRDLRTFFLHGSLCYPNTNRVSLTFEACQIKAEHRRALSERLAAMSTVPHADPQAEGFGFSLVNAVSKITGRRLGYASDELTDSAPVTRIQYKHSAIETIYGYWMPEAYADDIRTKIDEVSGRGIERLKLFGDALRSVPFSSLEAELKDHITGLRSFFAAQGIGIEPKADCVRRFGNFVEARQAFLDDPERIARAVRRLNVERMPDIWSDHPAAMKFERSFFEELSLALTSQSKSWVAWVLADQLCLQGCNNPDALKKALENRLSRGFEDGIWWDEIEDADDDD